jgi:hypothetical protein
MRDDGDGDRRNGHHEDSEAYDRTELSPNISQRKPARPGVQQGRDEHQEQRVRRQLYARQPRQEREQEAADHEESRVRYVEAVGRHTEHAGHGEQYQNQFQARH